MQDETLIEDDIHTLCITLLKASEKENARFLYMQENDAECNQ